MNELCPSVQLYLNCWLCNIKFNWTRYHKRKRANLFEQLDSNQFKPTTADKLASIMARFGGLLKVSSLSIWRPQIVMDDAQRRSASEFSLGLMGGGVGDFSESSSSVFGCPWSIVVCRPVYSCWSVNNSTQFYSTWDQPNSGPSIQKEARHFQNVLSIQQSNYNKIFDNYDCGFPVFYRVLLRLDFILSVWISSRPR